MFYLCLCNVATIRYFLFECGLVHLCGIDYENLSPHCCKWNSFGFTGSRRCGSACHGPHSDSIYSGSEHNQFDAPRLVKREAGFPNSWRVLIQGSHSSWKIIEILICFKIMEKSLNFMKSLEICKNEKIMEESLSFFDQLLMEKSLNSENGIVLTNYMGKQPPWKSPVHRPWTAKHTSDR